jgi:hypothetical protein
MKNFVQNSSGQQNPCSRILWAGKNLEQDFWGAALAVAKGLT